MSNAPSTPVKVPPSAANHSPATLDPDLRSQINTILLKEGHIHKIQEVLLHSLHANKSNWPTMLQAHALNLLRSGEVGSFPELLKRVLEDVKSDANARSHSGTTDSHAKTNGAKANGLTDTKPSLAIPPNVLEDMLKAVRESLESVVEIDESDS